MHILDGAQNRRVASVDDQETRPVHGGKLLRDRDRRCLQHAKIGAVPQTLTHIPPNVGILGHQQHRVTLTLIPGNRRSQFGWPVARQQFDLEPHTLRW